MGFGCSAGRPPQEAHELPGLGWVAAIGGGLNVGGCAARVAIQQSRRQRAPARVDRSHRRNHRAHTHPGRRVVERQRIERGHGTVAPRHARIVFEPIGLGDPDCMGDPALGEDVAVLVSRERLD